MSVCVVLGGLVLRFGGAAVFAVTAAVLTWYFIPSDLKKVVSNPQPARPQTVSWHSLQLLDYKTGTAPPPVQALHGKRVRVPGFVVPLLDNITVLKEFLLVPDPQACIHVPPPPPNLIVYVKLRKAISYRNAFNPAWVDGIIYILDTQSQFGTASWRMDGIKIFPYTTEDNAPPPP